MAGDDTDGIVAPESTGEGITRHQLELVIRRAAELAGSDVESDDRISEPELIRIAGELGLPPHHVRQALYELGEGRPAHRWADRHLGGGIVVGSRAVPGKADDIIDRLEKYLTAEEYLRLVRRREEFATFQPAQDVVSKVARAFRRRGSEHDLGRADGITLAVRPLSPDRAHVRVELDLTARRRGALGGVAAGTAGGFVAGGLLATTIGAFAGVTGADAGALAAVAGSGAILGAGLGFTGSVALARAWLRKLKAGFRTQTEGLLDRVERGDPLSDPNAAWGRKARDYIKRTTGFDLP